MKTDEGVGSSTPGAARALALLRVRQWTKNVFVLAGIFFSDQLLHASVLGRAAGATLVFCLVSSAVYVLNDIVDRHADAAHPEKAHRPLADGSVGTATAAVVAVALLAAATAVFAASDLSSHVAAFVGTYVVVNVAYTLWLKRLSIVDVAVVASGFVLRLEAGIAAIGVEATSWIVLCTGLLALFLALGKRRSDLTVEASAHRPSLDGYTIAFIDHALGATAASTIVVYALFTVSEHARRTFGAPLLYLTTFPVALGILRYMQIVMVTPRYASPSDVILRDRPLQLVVAVWIALFAVFVYL